MPGLCASICCRRLLIHHLITAAGAPMVCCCRSLTDLLQSLPLGTHGASLDVCPLRLSHLIDCRRGARGVLQPLKLLMPSSPRCCRGAHGSAWAFNWIVSFLSGFGGGVLTALVIMVGAGLGRWWSEEAAGGRRWTDDALADAVPSRLPWPSSPWQAMRCPGRQQAPPRHPGVSRSGLTLRCHPLPARAGAERCARGALRQQPPLLHLQPGLVGHQLQVTIPGRPEAGAAVAFALCWGC